MAKIIQPQLRRGLVGGGGVMTGGGVNNGGGRRHGLLRKWRRFHNVPNLAHCKRVGKAD